MAQSYSAPAGVDDATGSPHAEKIRGDWHKRVSKYIRDAKARGGTFFYDEYLDSPEIPSSAPIAVPWAAYPKWITTVFEGFPGALNEAEADKYAEGLDRVSLFIPSGSGYAWGPGVSRRQDESCEWMVKRESGKIVSMQFTAEPPEYWDMLYHADPAWTAELYCRILGTSDVKPEHLAYDQDYWGGDGNGGAKVVAKKGDYNPYNRWNVGEHGLVHLTQAANSLNAEVVLAADGTRAWKTANRSPTEQELICCAQYGEPSRHSDPFIGWSVHDLVGTTGACIALADPIGLYMTPFTLSDLKSPTEEAIGATALSFPRKSADGTKIVRAEVRVPPGANYGLEDCTLGGQKLLYGGQIARRITMALFAVAKKIPSRTRQDEACVGFCCNHPDSAKLAEGFRFKRFTNCAAVPATDYRELPKAPIPSGADALFAVQLKVNLSLSLPAADLPILITSRKL